MSRRVHIIGALASSHAVGFGIPPAASKARATTFWLETLNALSASGDTIPVLREFTASERSLVHTKRRRDRLLTCGLKSDKRNARKVQVFKLTQVLWRKSHMPAKSKAQQKAAGAALAAKRGETPVSKLKGASKGMYQSMSEKQLDELLPPSASGDLE